jgi:hypothetical protein
MDQHQMTAEPAAPPAPTVESLRARMLNRRYYVMIREPVEGRPIEPLMLDHYLWLIGLERRGLVFGSGPTADLQGRPLGGMTIFRTDTAEEADRLAAGDPFVLAGVMGYRLISWTLAEGQVTVTMSFSDQSCRFA